MLVELEGVHVLPAGDGVKDAAGAGLGAGVEPVLCAQGLGEVKERVGGPHVAALRELVEVLEVDVRSTTAAEAVSGLCQRAGGA